MFRKWLIFIGYAAVAVVLLANKGELLEWLNESGDQQIYIMFCLATLLAIVPVIPFGVTGGIIGMKYGPIVGGIVNVTSSTIAAVFLFFLVRVVYREQARQWLNKFKRLDRFRSLFENNAFMAVLIARLIPILPAPAVNAYAAVSKMGFRSYLFATLIGKIPVMFVFAWIGDQLFVNLKTTLTVLAVYVGFIAIVYLIYRKFLSNVRATKVG